MKGILPMDVKITLLEGTFIKITHWVILLLWTFVGSFVRSVDHSFLRSRFCRTVARWANWGGGEVHIHIFVFCPTISLIVSNCFYGIWTWIYTVRLKLLCKLVFFSVLSSHSLQIICKLFQASVDHISHHSQNFQFRFTWEFCIYSHKVQKRCLNLLCRSYQHVILTTMIRN